MGLYPLYEDALVMASGEENNLDHHRRSREIVERERDAYPLMVDGWTAAVTGRVVSKNLDYLF